MPQFEASNDKKYEVKAIKDSVVHIKMQIDSFWDYTI